METNDYIAAVAAELRAERAASRLTVKELSATAGVPVPTLNRYLAGERDVPGSTLVALAVALNVEPGTLLDRAFARAQGKNN
jgi:transcriptional regulator with XRE-family HTH domain